MFVQMPWEPTLVSTHLEGEFICLLCCVCPAPEISYQKVVSLLGEEREEERRRRREIDMGHRLSKH